MSLPKGYTPPDKKASLLKKCREDKLIFGTMMSVVFAITAFCILFSLELLTWQAVLNTLILTIVAWVAICYPAAFFIRLIARQKVDYWRIVKAGTITAIVGVALLLLLINIKFVVGDMYGRNEALYILGHTCLEENWVATGGGSLSYECVGSNIPASAEDKIRDNIDDAYTIVFWLTVGATMTVCSRIGFEAWRVKDSEKKDEPKHDTTNDYGDIGY